MQISITGEPGNAFDCSSSHAGIRKYDSRTIYTIRKLNAFIGSEIPDLLKEGQSGRVSDAAFVYGRRLGHAFVLDDIASMGRDETVTYTVLRSRQIIAFPTCRSAAGSLLRLQCEAVCCSSETNKPSILLQSSHARRRAVEQTY